ncbi:MAG: CopG family transcriptional regulator [Thermodesulfobacteriota bacterium]
MHRTTIMLPDDLRNRAVRRAEDMGVSLGELVRVSLDALLSRPERAQGDPLYADDTVYRGEAPADLSAAHDLHLYGEEPAQDLGQACERGRAISRPSDPEPR